MATVPPPPAAPAAKWRDGTYEGHGDSRHGDIDVHVVIKEGRIIEASISACNTRYTCEFLDPMIQQVIEIQSDDVNYISRATDSCDAYRGGLIDALTKALYPASGQDTTSP